MRVRVRVLLIVASLAVPLAAAPAWGDGDPASDVLIAENVFYPYSPPVPASLQNALNAETAAASRAGFAIKVALIASPSDLGAITTLFGKPQEYAAFLDQEISFLNVKPRLLIVMPGGYGVHGVGARATSAAATLRRPAGATTTDLARAAIVAVPKLAAAAGHPIAGISGAAGAGTTAGPNALAVAALAIGAVLASAMVVVIRHRRLRGHPRRARAARR